MAENMTLIYALIAIGVLALGLMFAKFRTSYIKSLYDKINSQEAQLGKTISQLAASKTINQNLEKTIQNQSRQIDEMKTVNTGHSDKLSQSYLNNKQLIQDLKIANEKKSELEDSLAKLDVKHQLELEKRLEELNRVEASYQKVSHSFEIMQKSNDNLREERDFYREEFMKLREHNVDLDAKARVAAIKSA
ncbi:MAG: hypothetical protein HWE16_05735 [Gammaproteobacteria bacterium]|nr:hypothetical protein [Gammaproteobacteria bacterium]